MKEELKTGYPHKDKMWLKYYDSEFLKIKNPSAGIYDYMKEKTKNIQDYTALSYFGKRWKVSTLCFPYYEGRIW